MGNLILNLPAFEPKLRPSPEGLYIKDIVRRKFVKLTPEEWVRQHFVNYLVEHLKYPRTLVRTEIGLRYSGQQKRADIVVFDRLGNPFIVVECKSFEISLTGDTLLQASTYQSKFKARYLAMTNGLEHVYLDVKEGIPEEILLLPACSF